MTFEEVMAELEKYGSEQTKKVLTRHGAREPFFGVKIGDMKKIVKKIKKDHELSLRLYETGNSDAMYLAGLIADEKKITRVELDRWADGAYWYMLSEYAVASVAAETPFGYELALNWTGSDKPHVAAAGWSALSNIVSTRNDSVLPLEELASLVERVKMIIHEQPNRVRYAMNNFIIATGSYVKDLTARSREAGIAIGAVHVEMGGTACKVPDAHAYIEKMEKMGRIGQKRKVARC